MIDLTNEIDNKLEEIRTSSKSGGYRLIDVFRANYHKLEELVNAKKLDSHKLHGVDENIGRALIYKTSYLEIQEILTAKGILQLDGKPVSTDLIGQYMSKVGREKGVRKSCAKPTPTNPAVLARMKVGGTQPVVPGRASTPEVKGVWSRPEQVRETVDVSVERLRREKREGLKPWSGEDEFFLMRILYEKNYLSKPKLTNNPNFWNDIVMPNYDFKPEYREVAKYLEEKLRKEGVFELYKDMK
jgi:hypothetical protein